MSHSAEAVTHYFDNLPRFTLSAMQTAWDKASAKRLPKPSIYRALCKEFDAVGQPHPEVGMFNHWVQAVERGDVPRPSRQTELSDDEGVANRAEESAEDEFAALSPNDFKFAVGTVLVSSLTLPASLVSLRDTLVEERMAVLQKDVRREAERQIAAELRLMANGLDHAA